MRYLIDRRTGRGIDMNFCAGGLQFAVRAGRKRRVIGLDFIFSMFSGKGSLVGLWSVRAREISSFGGSRLSTSEISVVLGGRLYSDLLGFCRCEC